MIRLLLCLLLVAILGLLASPTLTLVALAAAPVLWWLRRNLRLPDSLPVPEDLRSDVNMLAERAGVDSLDIVVVDEGVAAAALPGRAPAAIIVQRALVDWPGEQRRAVLAHEIAHIARKDFLSVILAMLVSLVCILASFELVFLIVPMTSQWVALGFALSLLLGVVTSVPASSWVQRQSEIAADNAAVELTGDPQALVTALEQLGALVPQHKQYPIWWERLISTHPRREDRIARIRQRNGLPGNDSIADLQAPDAIPGASN